MKVSLELTLAEDKGEKKFHRDITIYRFFKNKTQV